MKRRSCKTKFRLGVNEVKIKCILRKILLSNEYYSIAVELTIFLKHVNYSEYNLKVRYLHALKYQTN